MDVEGHEWAPLLQVFRDMSQGLLTVGQMQVELHTVEEVRRHMQRWRHNATCRKVFAHHHEWSFRTVPCPHFHCFLCSSTRFHQGAKHYINLNDQRSAMDGVRRLFDAADAAGMLLFSKVRVSV